ncbi:helicase-associated domain-containing protein, partial [Micromonospora sp. NPDC003776]
MNSSLADHLRTLPDESLAALLQLRPDLVVPVPADVSALAIRAQSRVSVARALDGLDQFTLQILDAARLTRDPENGGTTVDAILAMATAGSHPPAPAAVRGAVDRVRALFLLYGPEHDLHVVGGVDEVAPYPAGLGRPAAELDPRAAALCADPAKLRRTLLAAPPSARAILDRLAAGPPVGTVPAGALEAPATGTEDALPPDLVNGGAPTGSPIRWLVEHRLLVRMSGGKGGAGTVELPREVGLLLRRDSGPLGPLRTSPPVVASPPREAKAVDSAGAGQTMEVVRHTEALLESLSDEPAPVLRSGGVGVRDLRRMARNLGLDDATAALLFEVAYAAGLVGELDLTGSSAARYSGEHQILPTGGYEVWRAASLAQRWEQLARAWLMMTRQPGLVGQRDDRDRPISVLSAEAERAGAPP